MTNNICYKVLKINNGKLTSVVASGKSTVEYKQGEWISGISGTPLFVFRSLEDASVYVILMKGIVKIYRCQYDALFTDKAFMMHFDEFQKLFSPKRRKSIEKLVKFWSNPEDPGDDEFTTSWIVPGGTMLVNKIKLMEEV